MVPNHPLTFIIGIAPFDAVRDDDKPIRPAPNQLEPALVHLARLLGRQAAQEDATANMAVRYGEEG